MAAAAAAALLMAVRTMPAARLGEPAMVPAPAESIPGPGLSGPAIGARRSAPAISVDAADESTKLAAELNLHFRLLGDLDLLITGDTGPMHLAAAMGTPVVALFGPSDPRRYGPLTEDARILRVDLPCSPCGQVRLPPERCRGHVPDCMDGISVAMVLAAADELPH